MKRAKITLVFALALFLMCVFCSCKALHETALKDNAKPAADVPHSNNKDAVYDYGFMALSDEEMAQVFALFGLEGRGLEEFGTLEILSVSLYPNECFINLTYDMDKPYEEAEAALMDYMKGDWETGGDGANLYIFKDDASVTCTLNEKDEEIWLSYISDFEVPFIKAALADNWPPVLNMPEELSGQPDWILLSSMPEKGFVSYMRDWELNNEEEAARVFEWLSGSLEGNKIVSSDIDGGDKSVLYSIQGVDVMIMCDKDTLSINFSVH